MVITVGVLVVVVVVVLVLEVVVIVVVVEIIDLNRTYNRICAHYGEHAAIESIFLPRHSFFTIKDFP